MGSLSVIVVLIEFAVVGDVFPQQFEDSALEADGIHQQILNSSIAVTFDYFFDLPCIA